MDYGRWLNCAWMSAMRTNRTYAGAAVADAALVRTRGAFIAVSQLMSPYRSIRGPDCA